MPLFNGVCGYFWLFIFGDFFSFFSIITLASAAIISNSCSSTSEAMSAAEEGLRKSNIDQGRDKVGAHIFCIMSLSFFLVGECTPPYVFDFTLFFTKFYQCAGSEKKKQRGKMGNGRWGHTRGCRNMQGRPCSNTPYALSHSHVVPTRTYTHQQTPTEKQDTRAAILCTLCDPVRRRFCGCSGETLHAL